MPATPLHSPLAPTLSAGRLRRATGIVATQALIVALGAASAGLETALVNLLLAPWLEETLLRRGLQEALQQRWPQPRLTWLKPVPLCALVFAAAHVMLRPDAWSAATVLPALAIGELYRRRGALAPCVLLHALFNLLWFALAGPWLLSMFNRGTP